MIFSIVSIVNFAIYVLRTKFAYIYSISFLEIISTAIDFFTCFCQYMIMLLAKRILWYNIILNIIMKIRNLSSKSQLDTITIWRLSWGCRWCSPYIHICILLAWKNFSCFMFYSHINLFLYIIHHKFPIGLKSKEDADRSITLTSLEPF